MQNWIVCSSGVARWVVVLAFAFAAGLPPQALAADVAIPASAAQQKGSTAKGDAKRPVKARDIALTSKGMLYGQVVNADGKPLAKTKVALYGQDGKPVVAITNQQGAFGYQGLRGGVYCLQAGVDQQYYRVWAPKTAPPKAGKAVMLVADAKTVRGQASPPPLVNNAVVGGKRWLSHPVVIGGLAATAIAVPVSLADDDGPSS